MSEPPNPSKTRLPGSTADAWDQVRNLACEFTVDIALPAFKVGDVLKLAQRAVVNTLWPLERDVPLRVNGVVIGYGEFEVVKNHLAVRLTELA